MHNAELHSEVADLRHLVAEGASEDEVPSAHGLAHYPSHQTVDHHGVLLAQAQPANTKVESATAVAAFSDAESAAALQCQLEERDSQMDAVQVLQHPSTTAFHVSLLIHQTME